MQHLPPPQLLWVGGMVGGIQGMGGGMVGGMGGDGEGMVDDG